VAGGLHSGVYSGMIVACCEPTAPTGWLFCDGSQVLITQYQDLYNAIASTYNNGTESSGYFRLPNLINRMPAGASSTVVAGTLTGSNTHSHSIGNSTVNALSTNTDGSHSHSRAGNAYTSTDGSHAHTVYAANTSASGSNTGNAKATGGTLGRALANHAHSVGARATNADGGHWHNATPSDISGGGAHNHTHLTVSNSVSDLSSNTTSYAPAHQVKYIIKI
jgi:microcystin-dependent protein